LDSSTLLYKLCDAGEKVSALTFLYGQRHEREIQSAGAICEILKVDHRVVDLSSLKGLLSSSALTNEAITIPNVPETSEHYDTLKTTVVPNRNAILLCVAAGYATAAGINRVYYGAHFSDRGVYPDCRPEFVSSLEHALRLGTDNSSLRIIAPFIEMTKGDIVRLGTRLGVPYAATWSCYKGGAQHCGKCSSCRERKRAFAKAGVMDPTGYEG
jgi:7-cyano-7-deazaguanine synthase